MAHKELNNKADFDAALATKDRYVFIYAYEGAIPPPATENAKKFADTTDAYSLDVGKHHMAKEHFKVENVPTAIVYKDGKELSRVDKMGPDAMKAIEEILSTPIV
ncbi:uncharacterized protein BDR25DRAFT_345484 [Lindgomyces ingoldianus]|uniref:Uncharacterized protein n=1 Tax=Lindgomyces ingoldianus TaxID=673940 RepID=A0ACB6QI97_9PLEO|nr:uncharacterized protein BDR25DRAFT_345484 [Lindgomyces ingoldianus]KAF2466607.1 hypothetical protein BDR25DRAFT_345484 [Lindgomyces ingoldianus]